MLQTSVHRNTRNFLWNSGCLLIWLRIKRWKLPILDKMRCMRLEFFPSLSVSWDMLAAGKIMRVTAISATLSERARERSHPHHGNNLNLFLRYQHLHPVSAWMTAQSLQRHHELSWYAMSSQGSWQLFIKISIASCFFQTSFQSFLYPCMCMYNTYVVAWCTLYELRRICIYDFLWYLFCSFSLFINRKCVCQGWGPLALATM